MKLFTTALVDCAVSSKQLFESRKWIQQTGFALAFFAAATVAHALTLNYTSLPVPVNVAITPIAPVVSGAAGGVSYSIASGALPTGLSLSPTDGSISGTPMAPGSFRVSIAATDGVNPTATNLILIVIPTAAGLSADRPVLLFEPNGVFGQINGSSWPEQLFWQDVSFNFTEEHQAAAGLEADGLAPLLGCVAWGYEYTSATGGDPTIWRRHPISALSAVGNNGASG